MIGFVAGRRIPNLLSRGPPMDCPSWASAQAKAAFWNEYTETMPREQLDALHLQRLQALVDYAYESSAFYRRKFDACGLKPGDIRTLDDFKRKVPLTDKSEFVDLQLEAPPYGPTLAMPYEFVAHHCETSGTTGKPLAIPYSMYDTVRYGESWVYGFWALGIRPADTFYFAFGWGNFAGFWSAYWGARRLGCRVISGGGLDTKGHIQAIMRMRPTVLISTPTFALRMAAVAEEMGVDLSQSSIKFTYHAGEPGPTALPADARRDRESVGRQVRRIARHRRSRRVGARLSERRRRPRQRNERLLLVDEPGYRRRGRRRGDR